MIFLSRVTLKFDEWPWKTIGHRFYAASRFAHNFIVIGQFKRELQSGNAKFGSKSAIFGPLWPRNLTDDLKKSNKTPLLCYFKLCASFYSHRSIQTGVRVRKHKIRVKIGHLLSVLPWNLTDDLEKIGHLSYATSSYVHHFIAVGHFKLALESGNPKFG